MCRHALCGWWEARCRYVEMSWTVRRHSREALVAECLRDCVDDSTEQQGSTHMGVLMARGSRGRALYSPRIAYGAH